jgi:hypothetical protein
LPAALRLFAGPETPWSTAFLPRPRGVQPFACSAMEWG